MWLAVNKDGTERIFNAGKPKRDDWMVNKRNIPFNQWNFLTVENSSFWGYHGSICDGKATLIPGSIEKLIGRKLTWDDEPVEFDARGVDLDEYIK